VAVKLAEALNCGVNDLPLTIVLSWFEQKAVAVLLTLLHLGVKGITIGPAAPAFVSPNVFKILQEKYDLRLANTDPLVDLKMATASA
jgi:hydroxylamine reductase